jgi:hypothetical protein
LIEENLIQNEIHFTEEDFPPVSSISTTLEQTFNQVEGKQSIPSEIEDVLRNKTLLKQVKSFSFSFIVDNSTSNVRVVYNPNP